MRRLLLLLALLCGCHRPSQEPVQLRIVAAASMRDTLGQMVVAFEREHPGTRAQTSFVASGAAAEQISNGAPFDVFFSADERYPREVEERGKGLAGTRRVYARGRLVLWVPARVGIEPAWPAALGDARVSHVALANPEIAPYGRAARQALEKAGLWGQLEDKLVFGQDVAQVAQLVLASADVALLPRASALGDALRDQGRSVDVPAELYEPLAQTCILLSAHPEARALYDFALGETGRAIIAANGFDLP